VISIVERGASLVRVVISLAKDYCSFREEYSQLLSKHETF
jgi:hypothetical protein